MGNLCSKRKNSDSPSVKSDGSPSNKKRQDSSEAQENHSQSSKRPSQQNGTSQSIVGAGDGVVAGGGGVREPSNLPHDSLRSRVLKDAEPSSVSGDSMSLPSPTALIPPYVSSSSSRSADGKDSFALPLEIRKQSESVKNLLIGRIAKTKPMQKCRKITLYVCASYSKDYRLEKGNLHTEVYPNLRDYCSSRGYELHITDLHWKTDLESKQDHDFPELCLGELKRQLEVSYVIPVLFLSNSLGPTLLPKTMEQHDFETAVKNVGDTESKNLLEKWYSLDTQSQPPCYRLKSIDTHIPQIASDKDEEKSLAINEWHQIVEQILAVMLRIFPTELRDTYLTSVIEQEIHNSIFMSREVAKRSIWANRVFTHIQAPPSSSLSSIETEKNRRLEALQNELKNQLTSEHILRLLVKWQDGGLSREHAEHLKYLEELSGQLTYQLQSIVADIIEEDQTKAVWKSCYGVDGSLCSELMQQTLFCQQAAKCSPSIENVLSHIKSYIGTAEIKHPLILHGPKGCGKSCFLSRVIQQCSSWFPDALIIFRFVGLTPESRSLRQLFRTITSQLCLLLTGRNYWIPHNVACYQRELYKLLSSMTSPPLVLIVIDGLDELNPYEFSSLSWLSEALPSKMRLIISCADGSSVFQSIKAILPHEDGFISMSPLSQQAAESLLTASILQYNHSVDPEVQKKLSAGLKKCTLPLYIKVLAWQASVDTQGLIDVAGIKDLNSAISGLFDYLEKTMGKEKVEKTLELMCTSRSGLCDSELLDLLAHSPTFSTNITFLDWAPASLFLAQLHQRLGPFLEWGVAGDAVIVRWRDSALLEIAKTRYKSNNEEARKTLMDYFQSSLLAVKAGRQIENTSNSVSNRHNRRRLEEVPLQQFHLKGSIKNTLLCNIDWLLQKIRYSSVYSLIEDIGMETKGDWSKDPDLSLLCKTLELSASALSSDGQQFFGQMFGRLLSIFDSSQNTENTNPQWTAENCPFMKKLFDTSQKPSVSTFLPISSFLNGPNDYSNEDEMGKVDFAQLDKGETYFNEITRMKVANQFVASLSASKEEVIVWNCYTEKPVRILKGVVNPNNLKIIDEYRCVILCGRELHIFNLDDGTFITKLKGVMNQKMPYFGLHDSNHIVALSRNRMYVNLTNMESGDCVTTFKVGEDRFLNSLIVSDNGKILVCGDETQKPFPLLVWDLTSRKLLYDLRIPHHEFITNLSAITKEGHFVCCVCREVDDPGPNFIVVYDLQSGTLFKKWKPGYSTQAIAISAQGGCVINALENNRILVWDLVTGTCQWSLKKHTAPVDILRLDQKGSRCLSCDSSGRDRTVCLWDLTNGTLLALFTPDVPFTACDLSNDGDGVILGLKGRTEIVTLLYRDNVSIYGNRLEETFGADDNQGKVSDLKSSS